MDPFTFSQTLTRAALAVILSRILVTIRIAVRTYISFRETLFPTGRWKVMCTWVCQWQPKTLLRPTHLPQEEVDRYWVESDLYGRRLRSSDARHCGWKIHDVPPSSLVMYYVPRLLPLYRSPTITDIDAVPYRLSARHFCKWHHMVFRGPLHPTIIQAQRLMKNYSNRDLQEMYRISRLLSDEEVFGGAAKRTTWYKDMWTRWLNTKGPDVAIIFREPVL